MRDPVATLRRRCQNEEVRRLLIHVIRGGARYRLTRSGIIIYGPHGTAGTHFTGSDRRQVHNLRADLHRIGVLGDQVRSGEVKGPDGGWSR